MMRLIVLGFLISAVVSQSVSAALSRIDIAPNKRGFVDSTGTPYVPFGVNYYRPGTGWAPQVWKQFDAEATRRDFARMKEQGVNCVRVFLSYGSFCMEPGVLDPTGLDHWEGTAEWARVDRIADDAMLSALEQFWKQFAARYRGRNVIFAYDLRNEPEVPWDTPPLRAKWNRWVQQRYASEEQAAAAWNKPKDKVVFQQLAPPDSKTAGDRELLDYQLFREDIADDWTRRQVAAIKSADPNALVTVGLVQWSVPCLLPRTEHYAAFRPERQARLLDFMEIHFYPLNQGAYEYRNDEEEQRNLAYLESVVREAARPGKPVVLAEFGWYGGGKPKFDGGKHPAASEEQQARWCRRVVESTAGLAVGWLNWGFYDQPEATDASELTGLLTCDGKVKAWGREFKALADRYTKKEIPPAKLSDRPTLDWNRCIVSPAAGNEYREKYFQAWKADNAKSF